MSDLCEISEQLIAACEIGDLPEVRRLVESGADVNCKTVMGITPLLKAVFKGHVEVLRFLLSEGANVNHDGFVEQTALMNASVRGDTGLINLLIDSGADVNLPSADSQPVKTFRTIASRPKN